MLALSWRPVRNMGSRHQVMNASYNPWHIGNTYGLFGRELRHGVEGLQRGPARRRSVGPRRKTRGSVFVAWASSDRLDVVPELAGHVPKALAHVVEDPEG